MSDLAPLARAGHAAHCLRCLSGLPNAQTEVDASRIALAFYCIGSLDLLGVVEEKTTDADRELWREWIWEQQTHGADGTGFRPSPYMTPQRPSHADAPYDGLSAPHIIMTYTALLALAALRDDFARLDRTGVRRFLAACQRADGSFSTTPGHGEADLRTVYCAFAVASMLDDWAGIDVARAVRFIATCRTYEGGYGQAPFCEAQGGTTYIAIASLQLAARSGLLPPAPHAGPLPPREHAATVRWLVQNQDAAGGFCGRTNKDPDACYCFWCSAALEMLGAGDLVDAHALAAFVARCQFKYGGIAKAPGEHPDPYHTYLSLAALSVVPVSAAAGSSAASWEFVPLDPLLNAREDTAAWARQHIPTP